MAIDWSIGIGALASIALSAIAAWGVARARFALTERRSGDAFDMADRVRAALEEHKLDVARNYVSMTHLEKVEMRMIGAIDRVAKEVSGLRGDIIKFLSKADA